MSKTETPLLDRWQDHLRFQGRAPRTLEELAIAHADYLHRIRLAEIKALRSKLAQLDAFVPALAERGIRLGRREICTYDGGKSLRIPRPLCEMDDKLHAALLELGFREVSRKDWGRDDEQVTLKHGRSLLVQVDVRKAAVAPAPAAAPAVVASEADRTVAGAAS